ncbi:MAG: tetratricopeptide repeat protein [Clostridia bacterium]|nr:MAG: tetratricopeptide repeat protein [Clostridia bacterium]
MNTWVHAFSCLGVSWEGLRHLHAARAAAAQPVNPCRWRGEMAWGCLRGRVVFHYVVGIDDNNRHLDRSLGAAKSRLAADPDNCWLLNCVGAYLARLGKAKEALPYLLRAAERGSQEATIWANLGVAWVETGETVRGLECLDRALRLAGSDPQVLEQAAGCLEKIGRPLEAGRLFARAMELAPGVPELEIGRIRSLAQAEYYFEALLLLEKLLLVRPSPELWQLKAVVHEAMGGQEAAMQAYNRALGLT